MYCQTCKTLTGGPVCPVCCSERLRQIQDGDPCFLTEKETVWGEMLSDLLRQNGIPFLQEGVLGAGLAMKVGPMRERYRFYVPYAQLEQAQRIVEEVFSPVPMEEEAGDAVGPEA